MKKSIFSEVYVGLQTKIVAVVIMTTIAILSISYVVDIEYAKKERLEQMKTSAIILAKSLERSIITTKSFNDSERLQDLVKEFNRIDGVKEAYVIDKDKKIIAHPDEEKIGTIYSNKDALDALKYGSVTTEFKDEEEKDEEESKTEGELYDVVTPIHNGNKVVGAIEVELSTSSLDNLQKKSIIRGFLTIFLNFLAIGIALVVLLFKIVIEPIRNLANVTTEIAQGNFNLRLEEINNNDEIGELSQAFQKMTDSLRELSLRDKSANPLTGLPGNIMIQEEINNRIKNGEEIAVLYFDLDNFKAFNDCYGFSHGDLVLKFTAGIIQDLVSLHGNDEDFVGHIGGDDFVVITSEEKKVTIAKEVVKYFDKGIKNYYKEEDLERGYIEAVDRLGQKGSFPIVAISIAIVDNVIAKVENALELAEIAAELKHIAKAKEGSYYIINHRSYRRV